MPSPYWQLNDPEWPRTEYLQRGRTVADIATEVGYAPTAVGAGLVRHGIRRPPQRTLADVPADWLEEQYVQRKRSMRDIAAEVGLSPTSVRRVLVDAGIAIDDGRLPPELDDPDWLAAQSGVAGGELARRLGVTPEAVSRPFSATGYWSVSCVNQSSRGSTTVLGSRSATTVGG